MGLFGKDDGSDYASILAPDPASPLDGEVEPALVPGIAPSPTRVGLYGAHGEIEQSYLVEKADEANFAALARATYDGLAQLEIAIRKLNRKTLTVGPFVWTTQDTQIRGTIPADRLPINSHLLRLVGILTDQSAASENLTLTDLLPIPFSFKPAAVMDESISDDAGIVISLPVKAESFTLTKKGGGQFTTSGALYLQFVEGDMS